MNKSQLPIVAALCLGCLASSAGAQVAELYNPGFEIPFPGFPNYLEGWRLHQSGQAVRRWTGIDPETQLADTGVPATQVHSGIASVLLPGANGVTGQNYQAAQSEEFVPNVFPPVRNWPIYNFDTVNGAPITVSFWFMIPSDNPMVGSRFGLKAGFLRSGTNFSYYYTFDRLGAEDPTNVDPDTTGPVFPGCTIVTLGDGRKGIHTNDQWLQYSHSFDQQVDFIDQTTGEPFAEPPTNPAYASLYAARFGPTIDSIGIVWVDDFEFVQGEPPCAADFDGNGIREVADIFAFLAAWFANSPAADFDGSGLPVAVPDIFAFLGAWFAGCP